MDEPQLFDDSCLPPEQDSRVRSELRGGERLLWVGQPDPRRLGRAAWPIVLFGIPWTAFAVFWMLAAGAMAMFAGGNGPPGGFGWFPVCFPLFGLPFVLVGIAMLSSPFWLRRAARRTFYALTDQRAIVWEGRWFGGVEVRSYGAEQLTKLTRTEYSDGSGDLLFEEVVGFTSDSGGRRITNINWHGFRAIPDVKRIEELLRRVLLEPPPPPQG